jgi:succinate dehydrogenase hydrophobic anchor subunit
MMDLTVSKPKPQESTWIWLYKMIAGVMILVVLVIHLIVNHLVAPGGLLSYTDVIRYYKNPIIPIMEIFFLIVVVSHSLLGIRSIVLDLNPKPNLVKTFDWICVILGAGAILYGIWLVLFIASK